ncbi:Gp138 family membrane-puncturing spike protein [Klebsiella sp. JB_Kp042]|uniref:Gp138 family membrane-puncturing spike protein n=1 Tax=Klebsiella sp. JB_Kp042 TaxID=3153394 RepID=UPI0032B3E653
MLTKQKPSDMSCQGNAVLSLIAGAIKGCVFADIVIVKKVNGKTLTVFPLVTGTNASGGSIENQDVYNVPFIQYQAGNSSVQMTPRVGDIGLVIACDKDITNVKKTKGGGPPPTQRRHSYSDAVYITAIASLNDEPTELAEFTGSGINIKSPGVVNINGLKVHPDGKLELVDGSIVDGHTHGGVVSGGSRTDPLGAA